MTQGFQRPRRDLFAACVLAVVSSAALGACEAGAVDKEEDDKCPDQELSQPLVGDIAEAITAVEEWYGAPQQYFEISATLQSVSLIMSVDDGATAEQAFFVAGELVAPAPNEGYTVEDPTFPATDVKFEPDNIFRGVVKDLECPVLIDFAITPAPGGVAYDATVASDEGGVLLVLLGPNGEVQGVQAS